MRGAAVSDIVGRTYNGLRAQQAAGLLHVNKPLVTLLKDITGIPERTIQFYGKRAKGPESATSGSQKRPREEAAENRIVTLARRFVHQKEDENTACTYVQVRDHLLHAHELDIPYQELRRQLIAADIVVDSWGTDDRRRDDPTIVEWERLYVQGIESHMGTDGTFDRPLFFLDEGYINQGHMSKTTVQDKRRERPNKSTKPSKDSGLGNRVCMIACMQVRVEKGEAEVELLPACTKHWVAQAPAKMGDDYHGNFGEELFLKWFKGACIAGRKECDARGEEGGVFVLDNATYHKMLVNKAPTSNDNIATMKEWLGKERIELPAPEVKISAKTGLPLKPRLTKAQLYDVIKKHKNKAQRKVRMIAAEYGHLVLFTPPYHPEYQPMEVLWSRLKNPALYHARRTPGELLAYVSNWFTHTFSREMGPELYKRSKDAVARHISSRSSA